ncbi:MAG TPA: hypothetical protein VJN88_11620 [Ktedonobacterales bacterium]|nr:hypothetical protein [Ktedonobacterales bacterium]
MRNKLLAALDYLIVLVAALGIAIGAWGIIRMTSDHAADVWSYLMIAFGVLCLIVLGLGGRSGPAARLRQGYRVRSVGLFSTPGADSQAEPRFKGMETTLDND